MNEGQSRLVVCNVGNLCWTSFQGNATICFGVPLPSIINHLSLCSLDRDHVEGRCKNKLVNVEIIVSKEDIACNHAELLRTHSGYKFTKDSSLSVWKKNNGIFIIAFETWDEVKYLQVANVDGYVVTCSGLLLLPRMVDISNDERSMLNCIIQNSLWTNGKDVLNNTGICSTTHWDDLNVDVPTIELDGKTRSIEGVAAQSEWRACIGRALQLKTVDVLNDFQTCSLRLQRREYLFKQSLEVLNTCLHDENTS